MLHQAVHSVEVHVSLALRKCSFVTVSKQGYVMVALSSAHTRGVEGSAEDAHTQTVFESWPQQDGGAWNAMLAADVQQQGERSKEGFAGEGMSEGRWRFRSVWQACVQRWSPRIALVPACLLVTVAK